MTGQNCTRSGFIGGNLLYRRLCQYGLASAAFLLVAHLLLLFWFAPLGPASGVLALLRVSWPTDYGVNALLAQSASPALILLALVVELWISKPRDFRAQYLAAFGEPSITRVLKKVLAGAVLLSLLMLVAAVLVSEKSVTGISAFLGHPLGAAAYLAAATYLGIATLLHPVWHLTYKKAKQ